MRNRQRSRNDYAAQEAALIAARERQAGRQVEIRDALIAGIASARRATLATRNTRHFADLGDRARRSVGGEKAIEVRP